MKKNIFLILTRAFKTILAYLLIAKFSFSIRIFPDLLPNVAASIDIAIAVAIIEIIFILLVEPITKTFVRIYYPRNDTNKLKLIGEELEKVQVMINSKGKIGPDHSIIIIFPKWLDITTPHYPEVTRHAEDSNVYIIKVEEFGTKTFDFNVQIIPIYRNGNKKTNIKLKFKGNFFTKVFFWFTHEAMEVEFLERG